MLGGWGCRLGLNVCASVQRSSLQKSHHRALLRFVVVVVVVAAIVGVGNSGDRMVDTAGGVAGVGLAMKQLCQRAFRQVRVAVPVVFLPSG